MRDGRRRTVGFALVVAGAAALAVGYVAWAAARDRATARRSGVHVSTGASLVEQAKPAPARAKRAAAPLAAASFARGHAPLVAFRSMLTDRTFGKVATTPLAGTRKEWRLAPLACDRVYFAGGRGICLVAASAVAPVSVAKIFGPDFHVLHQVRLDGLASRTRVSRDGRYGATTTFGYGHSYASGAFSTSTTLIDLATGKRIANLEDFAVTREGRAFSARDFNFWGVTFARDANRFYATLASSGKTYLVRGDVRARSLRTLHGNVECPSLSPDETRIAFKQATAVRGRWRLAVLDLRTMRVRTLAEPESVDDQVEWLDDAHVLYSRANTVWSLRTDGGGRPEVFVANAASPTVVR